MCVRALRLQRHSAGILALSPGCKNRFSFKCGARVCVCVYGCVCYVMRFCRRGEPQQQHSDATTAAAAADDDAATVAAAAAAVSARWRPIRVCARRDAHLNLNATHLVCMGARAPDWNVQAKTSADTHTRKGRRVFNVTAGAVCVSLARAELF